MATDKKDPFEDLPNVSIAPQGQQSDPFESMSNANSPESKYSQLASAGLGAVQGGTLGFADELEGGAKALVNSPGNKKSLKDLYQQYRDIARQRYEQAQHDNPLSFGGGQVAGGLATALIPGTALAKGASYGAAALQGAALGGASALGSSNADLTKGDIGGAAKDVAIGGALGGALGAATHGITQALTPEALESTASNAALRSIDAKTLPKNQVAGTALLENGALPFTGGAQATKDVALENVNKFEDQLQPLLNNVKEKLESTIDFNNSHEIKDYTDFAQGLKDNADQVVDFVSKRDPNAAQNIKSSLNSYLGEIQQAGNDPLALNNIKREMYQQIKAMNKNAYSDVTVAPKVEAYQAIAAGLKDRVEQLAEKAGEGLGSQVQDINSQMSGLLKANKLLDTSINKQAANPPGSLNIGLGDMLKFGGAAALTHNPVLAGGALLAKKGIESATGNTIGSLTNKALAKTAYGLSKSDAAQTAIPAALQRVSPAISQTQQEMRNTPTTISQSGSQVDMEHLYQANPDQLKYVGSALQNNISTKNLGSALSKAVDNKDAQGQNAAIFAIMQNPNARTLLKSK